MKDLVELVFGASFEEIYVKETMDQPDVRPTRVGKIWPVSVPKPIDPLNEENLMNEKPDNANAYMLGHNDTVQYFMYKGFEESFPWEQA